MKRQALLALLCIAAIAVARAQEYAEEAAIEIAAEAAARKYKHPKKQHELDVEEIELAYQLTWVAKHPVKALTAEGSDLIRLFYLLYLLQVLA